MRQHYYLPDCADLKRSEGAVDSVSVTTCPQTKHFPRNLVFVSLECIFVLVLPPIW